MLVKEICKKCTIEFYMSENIWNTTNDNTWDNINMFWCNHCPTMEEYETLRSTKILPNWCIYKLEQIILGQDNQNVNQRK